MAALAYIITTLRDRFEDKERGATAVEYGLMVALIAGAIIVTVGLLGDSLDGLFSWVEGEITDNTGGTV